MTPLPLDDDRRHRHRSAWSEAAARRARPGPRRTPRSLEVRERRAPPRVLVMCGSSVSGFRLVRLIEEALDTAGVDTEELDLGSVAADHGRSLHLCEHCLAHGEDAAADDGDALAAVVDWTAGLRKRFAAVDALLLIAPVRGQELPIGLQPLFDRLAAASGAVAGFAAPAARPCALLLPGDTGEVGGMLSASLGCLGFAAPLLPRVPDREADLREVVRNTARALARAVADRRARGGWHGARGQTQWPHPVVER